MSRLVSLLIFYLTIKTFVETDFGLSSFSLETRTMYTPPVTYLPELFLQSHAIEPPAVLPLKTRSPEASVIQTIEFSSSPPIVTLPEYSGLTGFGYA